MTLYAYRCSACAYNQEMFRHVDRRDDPASCDNCGAPSLRQLQVPSGIVWKGHRPGNVTAREIMNGADPLNPSRLDPSFHGLNRDEIQAVTAND